MLAKVATSQKFFFHAVKAASSVRSVRSRCLYNYDIPTYYAGNFKPQFNSQKSDPFVAAEKVSKATDEVSADFGLGHYMTNVYKATGGGLFTTLLLAKLLSATALATSPVVYIGGVVVALGGIFSFNMYPPQYVKKLVQGKMIPYAEQPLARKASYAAIFTGMGMSLSPLIMMADIMSPVIIPMSIALTAFTFGGASLYAYNKPLGSFDKFRGILTGGLFGIIGMSLVSLGSYLIMGPNPLSYALMRIEPYIALGLFSGFIAYDTHQAIENYKLGDYDHLSSSVQMYLNVVNLLSSFIRIVMSYFRDE